MKKTKLYLSLLLIPLFSCSAPPPVEEGFLEIGETSLYFKTIGSGEPIVVLHGGPGFDHQILMPYIGRLGFHQKVIQYDQRGSGRSKGPIDAASINIETFVEDIEALRKHFKIKKLNLAGVSWGGILAMSYGVKYPENLNSLVLFSTAASSEILSRMYPAMNQRTTPEDGELLKEWGRSEGFKQKNPQILEDFYRITCKAQFADPSLAAKINLTLCENTAKNMGTVSSLVMSSLGPFDLHSSLQNITCPTLLLHGRKDPLPLEAAQKIHAMIPNSELILFDNSGHWIFIEEEERFLTIVNDFLVKVRGH